MTDSDFRAGHRRHEDFLGAFAVVERSGAFLMVRNERRVGGRRVFTWDLPGGQVEPGELLGEALARELREETHLVVASAPQLLFVQEGEKLVAGRRHYAWRSFFFGIGEVAGEARPGNEVQEVRWMGRADLLAGLSAPYHDSFRQWLEAGGSFFRSRWEE